MLLLYTETYKLNVKANIESKTRKWYGEWVKDDRFFIFVQTLPVSFITPLWQSCWHVLWSLSKLTPFPIAWHICCTTNLTLAEWDTWVASDQIYDSVHCSCNSCPSQNNFCFPFKCKLNWSIDLVSEKTFCLTQHIHIHFNSTCLSWISLMDLPQKEGD